MDEDRKPTILQVVPSLVTGGVERGTVEMVAAMKSMGWHPIVASSGGPMAREVAKAGGKHITLPLASKNPLVMWKNVEKLSQIVDAFKVDIIHARSRAPAWSAWHAAHRTGVHFVTTFHNAYGGHENRFKKFYNSVMAKGERVIAISEFVAEHAKKVYKIPEDRIRVIPRGVNIEQFDRAKIDGDRLINLNQQWAVETGQPVILLPGRLTRWKGQLVFIEAIARMKRRDMLCLIIGSGDIDYKNELIAAIKKYKLENTVKLVGECRDMPAAFAIADIVVSASTRPEGFGRVIVEAQAMGCAVIATAHGGAEETVKDGETGWLVPPGKAAKLAETLTNILAMPTEERKAVGKKAMVDVRTRFTSAMMAEKTMAVYDEILSTDRMQALDPARMARTVIEEPEEIGPDGKPKPRPKKPAGPEHILVIRFGALGDLFMCRQAFHDIREAHRGAEITLLTSPAYEELGKMMPWFDHVMTAERAPAYKIGAWLSLIGKLYKLKARRVYDLQGKLRQNIMFFLLGGPLWGPEWSGAAPGCSHPRPWPPAKGQHFVEFLGEQLRRANVPESTDPDLSWLQAPILDFDLPPKFAMFIPGCSPKLPHKRWPAAKYAELSRRLRERNIICAAIGTRTEADVIAEICKESPIVRDLSGRTDLSQIAALARASGCVIGNDTGPLHLAAGVGARTLAVLSSHTDPVWSAPYGPRTAWVKAEKIEDVSVDEVLVALDNLFDSERKIAEEALATKK